MTRARALPLVAVACLLAGCGGSGDYRVGAVFDTARGISHGSVVKIAGATVGEVRDVRLTADDQALVEIAVERRFAPFHADATCEVRPEGLIGVRSIDCDPGTRVTPLRKQDGLPTVARQRTQVPVDITDFFSIWAAPTRDRLRLLLNQLGMGLAGRGDNLNALLLRSSPALRKARRVLAILDQQRDAIADLVTRSDVVLGALARHRRGLRGTIRAAAATFSDTAEQRDALRTTLQRLPRTLTRTEQAARRISTLTAAATPVLRDLRRAAPSTTALLDRAPAFAAEAHPALRALSPTLETARRTLRNARPLARRLTAFTADADPTGRLLATLLTDARDKGVVEGLLHLTYIGAALGARFDAVSHLFPSAPMVTGCLYAEQPEADCDARYDKRYPKAKRRQRAKQRPPAPQPAPATAPTTDAPATPAPESKAKGPLSKLPLPPAVGETIDKILGFLLG